MAAKGLSWWHHFARIPREKLVGTLRLHRPDSAAGWPPDSEGLPQHRDSWLNSCLVDICRWESPKINGQSNQIQKYNYSMTMVINEGMLDVTFGYHFRKISSSQSKIPSTPPVLRSSALLADVARVQPTWRPSASDGKIWQGMARYQVLCGGLVGIVVPALSCTDIGFLYLGPCARVAGCVIKRGRNATHGFRHDGFYCHSCSKEKSTTPRNSPQSSRSKP